MSEIWDFIVIGGGAAGYFSAITFAETFTETYGATPRVLILEKSAHVLGKVKISGGGRCNVTHHCFDPKALTTFYPRGNKSLIGPFHRWNAADTVQWFENRGVTLKTEADGRMFPNTDSSQTIIDCLTSSAQQAGVIVQTSEGVDSILETQETDSRFRLTTDKQSQHRCKNILLATGGTRLAAGAKLATALGHQLTPNVPSLFTFKIADPRISHLPGVSVQHAEVRVEGTKLSSGGPLLVTHHGLSGPAILKLSAWGARDLHALNYQFSIKVNWLPTENVKDTLNDTRQMWGKRKVIGRPPFQDFPKRLWQSLCSSAGLDDSSLWSQLNKNQTRRLTEELTSGEYAVSGKSINKDEFVTCGGVSLKEVNLKTMASKLVPGLYFAGEILDIDGITGGFNFQNAWTTGHLAGVAATQ